MRDLLPLVATLAVRGAKARARERESAKHCGTDRCRSLDESDALRVGATTTAPHDSRSSSLGDQLCAQPRRRWRPFR